LDRLALLPCREPEAGGGEPIEIAERAAGGLVQDGDRVGREDVAAASGAGEPGAEVVCGVVGCQGIDAEAAMDARRERAIPPDAQAVVEVAEADEDEREQRLRVPLVVEQDVEMVERVLVQEVRLVEQEDGMGPPVATEVLD